MGEAEVGQEGCYTLPEPLRRVCKTVCFFCKSATGGLGLGEGDGGWIHADLMVKGITERLQQDAQTHLSREFKPFKATEYKASTMERDGQNGEQYTIRVLYQRSPDAYLILIAWRAFARYSVPCFIDAFIPSTAA